MKLWRLFLALLVVSLLGLPSRCQDDAEGEAAPEGEEAEGGDAPASEEPPADGETGEGEDAPASEEPPADAEAAEDEDAPAPEAPPADGEAAEREDAPASEDPPADGEAAEGGDAPVSIDPTGGADAAEGEDAPATEDPPAGEDAAEGEDAPASEEPPAGEDAAEGEAVTPAVEEEAAEGEPTVAAEDEAPEEAGATEAADGEGEAEPDAGVTEAPAGESVTEAAAPAATEAAPAATEAAPAATEAAPVATEAAAVEEETEGDVVIDMTTAAPAAVTEAAATVEVAVTVTPTIPGPPCESYRTIEEDARHFSKQVPHSDNAKYLCDRNLTEGWYAFKHQGEPAVIPTVCIQNTYCSSQLPWRLDLGAGGLPADGEETEAALCSLSHILQQPDCCVVRRSVLIRNCSGIYIYHLTPPDRCSVSVCTMLAGEEIPFEILGDPPTTEETPTTTGYTIDLPSIDVNDLTDSQMSGTATLEFKYPDQAMDENTMLEFDRRFRKMLADMLNQLYPETNVTTAQPDITTAAPQEQATEVVDSNVDVDSIPNVEEPERVGPEVPDIDPDAGIKGPMLRRRKQASDDRYTADDVHYVGPTPRKRDDKLQVAVVADEDDDGNAVDQERMMAALRKLNETGQLAQLNMTLLGIYPGLPEDMSPRKDEDLWEEHKALFITLIVLAIICLIVILIGLCCIKCRERGSWGPNKDKDTARIHDPKPRRHPGMEENPIPDDEITKDEAPMVQRENPVNGHQPISKRDEDNGWVVPIDQLTATEKGKPEVEDTKL